MQTAGLDSIIKAFLIIIAMYYILKFLAKIFLPILLKKVVEKAGQSFQQQQPKQQNSQNRDEIIIDAAKSKNPKSSKKVGEYVDYEEID